MNVHKKLNLNMTLKMSVVCACVCVLGRTNEWEIGVENKIENAY